MNFTKMHGIGNDYIYVNCFEEQVKEPEQTSIYVSNRRFGVGSDGLILISPSKEADCRMDIYNADGSSARMCGNGIRCVGKYVYDHGLVPEERRSLTVETLSGIKTLHLTVEDGKAVFLTVDMGVGKQTSELKDKLDINGKIWEYTGIDVGNPHAVTFVEDVDSLRLEEIGPFFEYHERFMPYRVNTEFVQVLDRTHLKVRVWERGSDETWACGTGATASVFASILRGLTEDEVSVSLRGGDLSIRYDRETGHLFMTGPAVEVFHGTIDLPQTLR